MVFSLDSKSDGISTGRRLLSPDLISAIYTEAGETRDGQTLFYVKVSQILGMSHIFSVTVIPTYSDSRMACVVRHKNGQPLSPDEVSHYSLTPITLDDLL
jgi:hypothetical protein